jgi:hypothetical protein
MQAVEILFDSFVDSEEIRNFVNLTPVWLPLPQRKARSVIFHANTVL